MVVNWHLLAYFVRQDVQHRYAQTWLGSLWSLIYPLVYICIFILVFSKIMGSKLALLGLETDEYGYSVYLISGMLPWTLLAVGINRSATVFIDKAGLIGKVKVPLAQLPLAVIGSELIVFAASMLFFAVFLLAIGFPVYATWVWLLPLLLLQVLLIFSVGLLLAVLVVFIRDLREFVNVFLQLWFWLTPIVYVEAIIPASYRDWFAYNPAAVLMAMYRDVIVHGQMPDIVAMSWFFGVALVLLYIANKLLTGLERDLRDLM